MQLLYIRSRVEKISIEDTHKMDIAKKCNFVTVVHHSLHIQKALTLSEHTVFYMLSGGKYLPNTHCLVLWRLNSYAKIKCILQKSTYCKACDAHVIVYFVQTRWVLLLLAISAVNSAVNVYKNNWKIVKSCMTSRISNKIAVLLLLLYFQSFSKKMAILTHNFYLRSIISGLDIDT